MTDHVILPPDQILTGLTVAQLENLITDVVRRVVREEMRLQTNEPASGQLLPESFLATFGVWEDVRPPEVIASEIYESRTLADLELARGLQIQCDLERALKPGHSFIRQMPPQAKQTRF